MTIFSERLSDVAKVKRRVKKMCDYAEPKDVVDLFQMLNEFQEKMRPVIIGEKIRVAKYQIEVKESEKLELETTLRTLEKELDPFDFTDSETKPTITPKRGGVDRCPDRERVMEEIGKGNITTAGLAKVFGVKPTTFLTYRERLNLHTTGEKSQMVYLTDEQDRLGKLNQQGTTVVESTGDGKTTPEQIPDSPTPSQDSGTPPQDSPVGEEKTGKDDVPF